MSNYISLICVSSRHLLPSNIPRALLIYLLTVSLHMEDKLHESLSCVCVLFLSVSLIPTTVPGTEKIAHR